MKTSKCGTDRLKMCISFWLVLEVSVNAHQLSIQGGDEEKKAR